MTFPLRDDFGIEQPEEDGPGLDEDGRCPHCGTDICAFFEGNGPLMCGFTGRVIER